MANRQHFPVHGHVASHRVRIQMPLPADDFHRAAWPSDHDAAVSIKRHGAPKKAPTDPKTGRQGGSDNLDTANNVSTAAPRSRIFPGPQLSACAITVSIENVQRRNDRQHPQQGDVSNMDFDRTILALCRAGQDLTSRQLGMLILCREAKRPEERQVNVIADNMRVSKPAITRAADRLEKDGFLTRAKLPGDKRTCVLTLTVLGVNYFADLMETARPLDPARRKRAA